VIVTEPAFNSVRLSNAAIRRVWTGANWAEGPAWSSQGQYLVFSDVSGNTQYRYIWEDGRVTPYRKPSNNTNGNSFDHQGRQLSCEDFFRRVVRWEHDGSMSVIAIPMTASRLTRQTTSWRIPTARSGSPTRRMATAWLRAIPTSR